MTLSDFRDLVRAWTSVQGEAYVTEDADVTAVINRALKRFAQDTLSLYDDDISFALTADTATYSLRDTAVFGQMIHLPLRVWVNGSLLQQVPSSPDMSLQVPGYSDAASAQPTRWFTQPPNHLVLYPAPADAYSSSRVSGWYLPPALEDDEDELVFPDEALDACAIECAVAILTPRATGDLLERVGYLDQLLTAKKAKLRATAEVLLSPIHVRRATSGRHRLG